MNKRRALSSAATTLAAALGLAFVHPLGNPRAVSPEAREVLLARTAMPDQAKDVLVTKCADCHSNATHWPFYIHLAPAAWLMERDVSEGRRHMDLSHWLQLSEESRLALSTEIIQEAKKGSMPPMQYRLLHQSAQLTAADIAALNLLLPHEAGDGGTIQAGDAYRGKSLFERKCTGCHSLEESHEGPALRGVYGRKAATSPGFRYSPAMRSSGVTWTGANLERWLRDSDAMLPESAMGFSVPKVQDRADIVAFLTTQK